MKKVIVFSDGACSGNPGPGGWAAILAYGPQRREISGGEPATTNNRMEIQGALEGLNALKEPCEVELFTDSRYLRDGITQWLPGWKRRGWRTLDKKPVKNEDLWRALDQAASRHKVTWHWVEGHSGVPENEKCDRLAVAAIERIRKEFSREQLKEKLHQFKSQGSMNPQQPTLV